MNRIKRSEMDYLSTSWCGLNWSNWAPLKNKNHELKTLPASPGVYKVRPIDKDFLVYIGQTGRSLRERMGQLRGYTKSETEMPFNDPHTAAPSLWAWRDAEGWEFQCSVAQVEFKGLSKPDSKQMREGLESYLLWKYRLQNGESTNCNFGRFHPLYFKSASGKSGRRGGLLPKGETNPSGGPSLPPLIPRGNPSDKNWMGLKWEEPVPLSNGYGNYLRDVPGIYRIIVTGEVVYIGQSQTLRSRINSHLCKEWGEEPQASVFFADENIISYQLHEWENDLIGGFFSEHQRPPKFQFKNLG